MVYLSQGAQNSNSVFPTISGFFQKFNVYWVTHMVTVSWRWKSVQVCKIKSEGPFHLSPSPLPPDTHAPDRPSGSSIWCWHLDVCGRRHIYSFLNDLRKWGHFLYVLYLASFSHFTNGRPFVRIIRYVWLYVLFLNACGWMDTFRSSSPSRQRELPVDVWRPHYPGQKTAGIYCLTLLWVWKPGTASLVASGSRSLSRSQSRGRAHIQAHAPAHWPDSLLCPWLDAEPQCLPGFLTK